MKEKFKKGKIVILFMLIISIPAIVKADTFSVSLDCNKYTSSIASMSCKISLNNDFVGSNLKMNIKSGNSKISFTPSSGINYTFEDNVLTINNNFNAGTLYLGDIKVAADIYNDAPGDTKTVTVSDISITNSSGTVINGNNVSGSSYLYSETIGLSSLTISGLSFTFQSDIIYYNLEVDSSVSSVTISAEKKDNTDTVTGTGTHDLNYGLNTIEVIVTNKEGVKKPYILNITRLQPGVSVPEKKKNNYLTKIKFLGYEIDFDKNKTEYDITVDNNVSKFATCTSNVNDINYLCLVMEDEYFAIDGESYEFIFNGKDEETYLEELEKLSEEIEVKDNDEGGYSGYVDGELIWKTDENANVLYTKMYYGDLKVGENVLKVVVVAENGDERTYTFTINRKSADGKLSTEKELEKSPSTGSALIIVICIILVISLGVAIYFIYKKNNVDKKSNDLK